MGKWGNEPAGPAISPFPHFPISSPSGSLPWAAAARIAAVHDLGPLRDLQPLSGGWINPVFLLNGEFVLRVRPAEKSAAAFHTEAALFARLRSRLPVPEVVAVDDSRQVVDADYMLTRRLPGESLTRAWLRATPREQERLAAAFADLLRAVHAERFPACGRFEAGELQPFPSWQNYLALRFERRLAIVRGYPNADRALIDAIEARWRGTAECLAEECRGPRGWKPLAEPAVLRTDGVSPLPCVREDALASEGFPTPRATESASLVHRDLHFGNVLVQDGRVTGVLDFEAAVAGPVDYELDQLARFVHYPYLFAEPELAEAATPEAFAAVWPLLRRHYPELFAVPRLAERLALYALEYELAALRDCYAGRWGPEGHRAVLARIHAALQGEVAPECRA